MDLHVSVFVCMKDGLQQGEKRPQHSSVFLTYVNAFGILYRITEILQI